MVGVKGIDFEGFDHPAEVFVVEGLGVGDPGSVGVVHGVVVVDIGVGGVLPDCGPIGTAISAAPYDGVGIPTVKSDDHYNSWTLGVDR